jgi:hypothetical protein
MKLEDLFEARKPSPDWAQKEQTEFAAFIKQFGMQLMTRKVEHRAPDQWMIGGDIKDTDKSQHISLPIEMRFKALKKGLSNYLLDKAKDAYPNRYVKLISNPRGWRTSPHYIQHDDRPIQVERIVDDVVHPYHYQNPGQWSVCIMWSISEPKS